MEIILDINQFCTRSRAHAYLKEMLAFPEYYGENLDALHDCLTSLGPTHIRFQGKVPSSGEYYQKILRVFRDSARENPDLVIEEAWQDGVNG